MSLGIVKPLCHQILGFAREDICTEVLTNIVDWDKKEESLIYLLG